MKPASLGRAALACAVFSLCWGSGIFLLWTVTRWQRLEELGALWLAGGTLTVLVGLGLLFLARAGPDKISVPRAGLTLILLLANFPAAFGIVFLADWLKYPRVAIDVVDVTKPQKFDLTTVDPYPNSLEIWVRGTLEGKATLRLDPDPQGEEIGPGRVDRLLRGGDFYQSQATLIYEPRDVRAGTLRIVYQFH